MSKDGRELVVSDSAMSKASRTPDRSAATPDAGRWPDEGLAAEIRQAEILFHRLMSGAARDDATRTEFAAILDRRGLTLQQRATFLRRFLHAAEDTPGSDGFEGSR
jgi:hypothetical protein